MEDSPEKRWVCTSQTHAMVYNRATFHDLRRLLYVRVKRSALADAHV